MTKSISILTYNIHKGFSSGNREFILRRIRDEVQRLDPDLVFLQEVVGEHIRRAERVRDWPLVSQAQYLSGQTWPHFLYGRNRTYRHGHHGNALLSKFEVLEWSNFRLTSHRLARRGVLSAKIALSPKRILTCACLHLSLLRRGRDRQLDELAQHLSKIAGDGEPLIVAGDFNDWTGRASLYLEKHAGLREVFREFDGEHARTFPSNFPVLRLDRIYYRGLKVSHTRSHLGRPWCDLSDHVPLEAHFRL